MKKITLFCIMMAVFAVPLLPLNTQAASQKSDGKNMAKVIKCIKSKDYSSARKYNNKLNATAVEKCTSTMSKGMKKAYLKIVNKYPVNGFGEKTVIRDYYLTDINNDKKADLLVVTGSCEGDSRLTVYQYKKGKAKKTGSIDAIHASYSAYPNHKGIVEEFALTGYDDFSLITLKNNKLVRTKLDGTTIDKLGGSYFSLRCKLKSHYRSSGYGYYSYGWMDTSDLR